MCSAQSSLVMTLNAIVPSPSRNSICSLLKAGFPKISVYLLQPVNAFSSVHWTQCWQMVPTAHPGRSLILSSFRVIPAQLQNSVNHQAASQKESLKLQWPKLEGEMREGWLSGRKAEENFPAQSADGARCRRNLCAPCHYWGITGPSVQLLSLPSPRMLTKIPHKLLKSSGGFTRQISIILLSASLDSSMNLPNPG